MPGRQPGLLLLVVVGDGVAAEDVMLTPGKGDLLLLLLLLLAAGRSRGGETIRGGWVGGRRLCVGWVWVVGCVMDVGVGPW